MKKIYSAFNYGLIDRIVLKKRKEIVGLINKKVRIFKFNSIVDIGTTEDSASKSSNFIIKNIKFIKIFKSISDQNIKDKFFKVKIKRSILKKLDKSEKKKVKSNIVISSATIEHVGSRYNQYLMIKNMIKISKNFVIFTTPNKLHPIEFHTKIPLLHMLPKRIYRKILRIIGLAFFAEEKNLNLLSKKDLIILLNKFKNISFQIFEIKLFFFVSNFVIFIKLR